MPGGDNLLPGVGGAIGQGLLTLLVGLLLMNFPGKYQLERWLVGRPGVLAALDWLRQRKGEPPFDPPAF